MDSDEEDFVVLGTPLDPLEDDDELPAKKPIHEQTVHDEKGRRRFHGAFTGGFSAGYFNSVGSKEGWAPSSFLSSRSQKAEKIQQNPEDFMDDEDLGAFGIAPRRVQVLDCFCDDDKYSSRKRILPASSDGPIPGVPPLKELVKPVSASVGVKMLQQMGWRPGQGIGPRKKRKQKLGTKMYGCAPPPSQNDSEDEEDDPYAAQFTFAPKDQEMLPYEPKDNLFGIGYTGLSKDPVLSAHVNLFEPIHTSATLEKKKKLLISGEAFGVGAFEEEDTDIYAKDDMTQYVFSLEESRKAQDSDVRSSRSSKTVGYIQKVLEGFHLSTKPVQKKPNYPPPSLPPNFKPIHQPSKTSQQISQTTLQEARFLDRHEMSSKDRTAVLEGQSASSQKGTISSVFDLISPEDKLRLQNVQKSMDEKKSSQSHPHVSDMPSSFKPFQSDPEKQARYEKYQTLLKMGKIDCLDTVHPYSMTEWEKQREKEEFQRAAMLYRPLSGPLSSRFVSSSKLENDREVEIRVDEDGDKTDQKKAAGLKMYGRLTRERFEWHPAALLCKRFNVPNPYPDCKMVGLPKVKRDKYSIFNFLTVPSEDKSTTKAESSGHITPPIPVDNIKKEVEEVPVNKEAKIEMENSSSTDKNDTSAKQVTVENEPSKPPMDLFKAIFQNTSSEESSSSDEEHSQLHQSPSEMTKQSPQKTEEESAHLDKNKAENFPSAFGVFANIDLDAINRERVLPPENSTNRLDCIVSPGVNNLSSQSASTKDQNVEVVEVYGPKLPPVISTTSNECIYIGEKKRNEREHRGHRKHKKHKHHKHKEKSKLKKTKHKHKKSASLSKETRHSSEESSEDSEGDTDVQLLQRLNQLKKKHEI